MRIQSEFDMHFSPSQSSLPWQLPQASTGKVISRISASPGQSIQMTAHISRIEDFF
jgi:hypothetical protein